MLPQVVCNWLSPSGSRAAPGDNAGAETYVIWICVVYKALDGTLKMNLLEYSLSCGS